MRSKVSVTVNNTGEVSAKFNGNEPSKHSKIPYLRKCYKNFSTERCGFMKKPVKKTFFIQTADFNIPVITKREELESDTPKVIC